MEDVKKENLKFAKKGYVSNLHTYFKEIYYPDLDSSNISKNLVKVNRYFLKWENISHKWCP